MTEEWKARYAHAKLIAAAPEMRVLLTDLVSEAAWEDHGTEVSPGSLVDTARKLLERLK